MRNIVVFLAIGLCSLSTVIAQKGFKIGGMVLPQMVWLSNENDAALNENVYQAELLGGMAAGLQVGYNPTPNFGLRMNILYSQQGGKYSYLNNAETRVNQVNRLEYLKVPVMIGLNANPRHNKIMLALYGGLQFGALTKAYSYNNNTEYELPLSESVEVFPTPLESYSGLDLSLVGDVGVDIKLNYDLVLNMHLRVDYGLRDAENKESFVRINDQGTSRTISYWDFIRDMNNRSLTRNINLGLMIGITYTFVED